METIAQYDRVLVRAGKYTSSGGLGVLEVDVQGCVVDIYGKQEAFEVDVGTSPDDWETISVKREDIIKKM